MFSLLHGLESLIHTPNVIEIEGETPNSATLHPNTVIEIHRCSQGLDAEGRKPQALQEALPGTIYRVL